MYHDDTDTDQGFVGFEDSGEGESFVFDPNAAEGEGGGQDEVLPAGIYNCYVEEVECKCSDNSGNPMWTWVLEVADGEYAGRRLWYHTVFAGHPRAVARTRKTLSMIAPHLMEQPFEPQKVAESGDLVGTPVRAKVKIGRYEGRKTNNVRELLPAEENLPF